MNTLIFISEDLLCYFFRFVVLCWVVWVGFCALMAIQKVKADGKLKGLALWFAYPLLAIFVPLDFFLNLVSSIVFLEIPRYRSNEWLFTARMKRYYNQIVSNPDVFERWRHAAGKFITVTMLNNVSEAVGDGKHV